MLLAPQRQRISILNLRGRGSPVHLRARTQHYGDQPRGGTQRRRADEPAPVTAQRDARAFVWLNR